MIGGYSVIEVLDSNTTHSFGSGAAVRPTPDQYYANYREYGFSYGAGINIGLGKRWDLNLEYMNWHTEEGAILQNSAAYDGLNAGVAFKF